MTTKEVQFAFPELSAERAGCLVDLFDQVWEEGYQRGLRRARNHVDALDNVVEPVLVKP